MSCAFDASQPRGSGKGVELISIGRDNWRDVAALRVRDEQVGFVAPNPVSMLEAQFEPEWTSLAIASGERIVGYVCFDCGRVPTDASKPMPPAWIGSLMIAARWQGRGFGRRALSMTLDEVRVRRAQMVERASEPLEVHVTVHPANVAAFSLYQGAGFTDTGRLHDGDRLLRLTIPPRAVNDA